MSSVKIAFVFFIYKNLLSFLSEKQKAATRVAVFCYFDLINHMGYKNMNDLLECDKQQLMKFLNKLVKKVLDNKK